MGIKEKDWIQLSSYLDGELSKREETKLEDKLAEDPQFQAALDQLRNTKKILQSTPELPVPRNFTLTSAQVGKKTTKQTALGFRLAAATMTFLLIGTLVIDFGRFLLGGAMAPAAPRMEEVMLESAADEPAESLAYEAEGEVHQDRAAADSLEEVPAEEAVPDAESVIQEGDEVPPAAAEAVEGELGIAAESPEEKTTTGEETDTAENMAKEAPQPQTTGAVPPTQTPVPQPTAQIDITLTPSLEPTAYYYPEEIIYQAPWYTRIPIFKILEIVFGLGVIGFGSAAWLKRRRR